MKIKTSGCPFSHDVCSCHGFRPTEFEWCHEDTDESKIKVYFDYNHRGSFKDKKEGPRFLWICESRSITGAVFEDVENNADEFFDSYDAIFVHDRSMIEKDPRFTYVPNAANKHWVKDHGLHEKTKKISMISSGKNMCPGHLVRNKIAQTYLEHIDLFGRFHNPIERKEEGLNKYMFSFAVENGTYSTYITEKLMDCFATGTIPIYLGSPDVGDYFDPNGIITLEDDTDLSDMGIDIYESKMESIKNNYEVCMSMKSADDLIYEEIKKYV